MIIVMPQQMEELLENMYNKNFKDTQDNVIKSASEFEKIKTDNSRFLFIIELSNSGINIEMSKILEYIRLSHKESFKDSVAGIIIHSNNEYYTRSYSREIILTLNMHGCIFFGRPLVEATGSLKTFRSYQKTTDLTNEDLFVNMSMELYHRLNKFKFPKFKKPKITVIHASNINTSNTVTLWNKVRSTLQDVDITEIHIENGRIRDCNACPFTACLHFGESNSCFYGGIIVEEVYPAILECDALVFLCPNYNDSISANLAAMINRVTALFRTNDFTQKYIYSVIVSGYCGSDILAEQLISSININKTFILPPYFALMQTANDKGEIAKAKESNKNAYEFAKAIEKAIIKKDVY